MPLWDQQRLLAQGVQLRNLHCVSNCIELRMRFTNKGTQFERPQGHGPSGGEEDIVLARWRAR